MPTSHDSDLDGLSPSEQRLLLLLERRLHERLGRRLDAKLAAIRQRIDKALLEVEAELLQDEPFGDDDDNDFEDHQPRAEGA